jgi:ABC-type transport system involved in multi-copper enzyme maturation permease subunit
MALTRLAIKESIRRRVVVVFVIFVLLMFFAGWFMQPNSANPAILYIDFVMTATTYLVLILTGILCSLSLPTDLKNKTLHTVVTKPVRPSEIILGRILGFVAIGTVLLVFMSTMSYFFVVRSLAHTHTVMPESFKAAEGTDPRNPTLTAETSSSHKHFHAVTVDAEGNGRMELKLGHTHSIEVDRDPNTGKILDCKIGPAEEDLIARVPVFGWLYFHDKAGRETQKGISVGKEWTYRTYIEGNTKQAAIWKFQNITEDRFPDGLPVALGIRVYRSWKGIMNKGIPGNLSVRVPGTDQWVEAVIFTAQDGTIDYQEIPRHLQMRDPKNPAEMKTLDLFRDLASDGVVEIKLQCLESAQYFGVARADCYIRSPNASFYLNFMKGYLGIWLQMCILATIGVFFSTFLSGPVALISTKGTLIACIFHDFLFRLANRQTYGGGPLESVVRLATQDNVISELPPGFRTTFVQASDSIFLRILDALSLVIPNFDNFSLSSYVANGFNISGDHVLHCFCSAAAFLVPVFIVSYLCFKLREVAK